MGNTKKQTNSNVNKKRSNINKKPTANKNKTNNRSKTSKSNQPKPSKNKKTNSNLKNKLDNKPKLDNNQQKKTNGVSKPKVKKEEVKLVNKSKKFKYSLIIFIIFNLLILSFILFTTFYPKFKSINVELGMTSNITIDDFLVRNKYKNDAKLKTDLTKLDLSKVSEHEVIISYKNKDQRVRLNVVDTTKPTVLFKDVAADIDYQIDANDFVVEKYDLSEMSVVAKITDEIDGYNEYILKIIVEDKYGNQTTKNCLLNITWLKPLVYVELGTDFSKEDIVFNMENNSDKIDDNEIAKVNPLKLGEYNLVATYNDKLFNSTVIVQDTTAPNLVVKNITLLAGEKIENEKRFIKSVSDLSGEITTSMKSEIDYTKLGTQEIVIEAVDASGNKTVETATLTIKKNSGGTTFYGLSAITIKRNQEIDFIKDVYAIDSAEGTKTFSVDSSKVNTKKIGTYYATYISVDNNGIKTTAKRKIIVTNNEEDTDKLFDEFFAKYLNGKNVLDMVSIIRSKISYSHEDGGSDPVWYALNNGDGDCYVHAILVQKALDKAGIENQLIYVKDKTHYWNLVYQNGSWRHFDSTPGTHIKGPATDSEKAKSAGMLGRDWDREAFPKAI